MEGHKLLWHPDRINDWLNGKTIAPIYLDMGITQTCNIGCKYCYYAVPENKTKNSIPTDSLIKFLHDAASIGVKAVGFLGDGEPMVHPGVYSALIAGAEAGLDMAISTNGLVMKDEKLKESLASLAWIRFNLSAVTPIKFAKVMNTSPNNLYKIINNIRKCIKIKKQYNLKVTIGLQMVLIAECTDEIIPFVKLGKDLGVDYAVIKQCSESASHKLHLINEGYKKLESLFCIAESYSNKVYDVIVKRKKITNKGEKKYNHCFGCEFLPQISGNGDVYNCGNFFGNTKFLIGNIIERSFKDIVFSARYKEVMEKVKNEVDVHKDCGTNCRQDEINNFLWTLKNPPPHINFI